MSLLRPPKAKMALVLSVLSAACIVNYFSPQLLARLVVILVVFIGLEYLFWKVRKISPFLPSASVVSSLIIFLLADPTSPLMSVLTAILIAVASKQFLRPKNNHIFNPGVFGLVTGSFLGLQISWWGVSWGYIPLAIIILGAGYISLYSIRQYNTILSFLTISVLEFAIYYADLSRSLGQLLVGSFWFFALVMLPEPMTSAHFPKTRLLYGSLVALIPMLLLETNIHTDPLLLSLLAGNLFAWAVEKHLKA